MNKTEEDPPTEVASWGRYLIGVINTVKKRKGCGSGEGVQCPEPSWRGPPPAGPGHVPGLRRRLTARVVGKSGSFL